MYSFKQAVSWRIRSIRGDSAPSAPFITEHANLMYDNFSYCVCGFGSYDFPGYVSYSYGFVHISTRPGIYTKNQSCLWWQKTTHYNFTLYGKTVTEHGNNSYDNKGDPLWTMAFGNYSYMDNLNYSHDYILIRFKVHQ